MKRQKQLRKIHLDGIDYYWLVQKLNPRYVLLKVWHALSGKNSQYIQVRIRFDDPRLNYGPIITAPVEKVQEVFMFQPLTPAIVRQIIQAALKQGWQVGQQGAPLNFTWDDKKGLIPATDIDLRKVFAGIKGLGDKKIRKNLLIPKSRPKMVGKNFSG